MPVHPVEYRYSYPDMYNVWTEESKLQKWLDVEAALAEAHAEVGNIPREAAMEIRSKAKVGNVTLERIKEIEREIHHDVMAMVQALTEVCEGDAGRYIHLGATSYDIVDTALGLLFRDALDIIEEDLKGLLEVLLSQASSHIETICIGRTHGQHALPTTYGMKFGVWAVEVARHLDRLEEIRERLLVGKMNGAVGTMASFGEQGFEIQEITMRKLGLEGVSISNQVIQRDRHAELQITLALIAGTVEKIAGEIRNLQRTEIAEAFEPFGSGQVGSSTMPHKRNPHKSERICGLSRVVRSLVNPSLETIALEHERDLTNSSLERVTIPEGFILTDYILRQATSILDGLVLKPENIKNNLEMTLGLCLTERVMLELVEKGMGRQEAHEIVRKMAMKSWEKRISLKEVMMKDPKIGGLVTDEELERWLHPGNYLGTAIEQVDRVIQELRIYLE
ncbi:MAG: adenylosuccinate lyase [Candidatus Bathyarchaeia archaeon]